jgi:hypothetical protein
MDNERVVLAGRSTWDAWPVSWSSVWVGTLTALAVGLVIALISTAVGAHQAGSRIARWNEVRLITVVFAIAGSFFAFAAGGWVAARIAGIRRAEPAMLHGAITWLVAVPLLVGLGAIGAGSYLGGWYGGLGPVTTTDAGSATAARNAALAAVTTLLVGLVGSVIGGWMASGERMVVAARRMTDREQPRRRDVAA